MIILEHNLTVDDLIIEYLLYKVKNNYEPNFTTNEFMSFLHFFEKRMPVCDSIYDNEVLFKRFFDRQLRRDSFTVVDEDTLSVKREYSKKEHDYIISAKYKFSNYIVSTINTYFMDKKVVQEIRNIIGEYLSIQPKRKIDEQVELGDKELMIGKYFSAEIILQIWFSYINKYISKNAWPEQCMDINKYLIDIDLAEIIGLKSIRSELIELYVVLSKRIAALYKKDKDLKVTSYQNGYLAYSNYVLLIRGYEDLFNNTIEASEKWLEIDLSKLKFKESHVTKYAYYDGDEPIEKINTISVGNDQAKKLIQGMEEVTLAN